MVVFEYQFLARTSNSEPTALKSTELLANSISDDAYFAYVSGSTHRLYWRPGSGKELYVVLYCCRAFVLAYSPIHSYLWTLLEQLVWLLLDLHLKTLGSVVFITWCCSTWSYSSSWTFHSILIPSLLVLSYSSDAVANDLLLSIQTCLGVQYTFSFSKCVSIPDTYCAWGASLNNAGKYFFDSAGCQNFHFFAGCNIL